MNKSLAVIDANIAINSVLHTPFSEESVHALEYLQGRRAALYAPGLWWFEITSIVHRCWLDRRITHDTGSQSLEILTIQSTVQPVQVQLGALD